MGYSALDYIMANFINISQTQLPIIQPMCYGFFFFFSYISMFGNMKKSKVGEEKREEKAPEHQAKSIPRASSRRLKEGFSGRASDWLIYMDIKGSAGEHF